MSYVLVIKHKVQDYKKFKANFNDHGSVRKSAGEKSYQIFPEQESGILLKLVAGK